PLLRRGTQERAEGQRVDHPHHGLQSPAVQERAVLSDHPRRGEVRLDDATIRLQGEIGHGREVEQLHVAFARGLQLLLGIAQRPVLDLQLDLVHPELVNQPLGLGQRAPHAREVVRLRAEGLRVAAFGHAHDPARLIRSSITSSSEPPSPDRGSLAPCARRSASRTRSTKGTPSRNARSTATRSRGSPRTPPPSCSRPTPINGPSAVPSASAAASLALTTRRSWSRTSAGTGIADTSTESPRGRPD